MTTMDEVAEALVEQIMTPVELRAVDHIPEDTSLPAGMLAPPRIDYDALDDGELVYEQDVVLLTGAQVGRHQKKLRRWMAGPDSIHDRLQLNRSLGFDDVDARAVRAAPIGLTEFASYRSYGAIVTVQVIIG